MKVRLCRLHDFAIVQQTSFLRRRYFSSGHRHPEATGPLGARKSSISVCPKRRTPAGLAWLSSGVSFRQNQIRSEVDDGQHRSKRKTARAPAGKTSLRKVAIEAQRSRDLSVEKPAAQDGHVATKVVRPLRSRVSVIQLTRIYGLLDSHSILCR